MKHIGIGGQGSVFLVERKTDWQKFAAKKQVKNNKVDYDHAKLELVMLQKVDHPNVVKFFESFFSEEKKTLVIIIEFCSCKFVLFLINAC